MQFEFVYLVIGIAAGIAIGWLLMKQKTSGELSETKLDLSRAQTLLEARGDEDKRISEMIDAERKTANDFLKSEFKNLAAETGKTNREEFMKLAKTQFEVEQKEAENSLILRKEEINRLVEPIKKEMANMAKSNIDIEKERESAYQGIKRQLKELGDKAETLGDRTTALSTALTTSGQARGNWGEVKLRRLFEIAGLPENIDFTEQETVSSGGRPDFIVRLPDMGVLPIDSKAVGGNFLQAVELDPGPEQEAKLSKHAIAVKERIKDLAKKSYQESIEGDFDHVIMFIPSESMAAAAFQQDPNLLEFAMKNSVIVTTPMTMLGLLRTIALYWQQHALAEGAGEIYEVTREMYKRINTMIEHMLKVGSHIEKAVGSYNDAMRSYESRVLPQGRRLDDLKVSDTLQKILPKPKEVNVLPAKTSSEEE